MNRSRMQRVEEIFFAAVDASPEAQQAVLDRECGDDADLRAEVETLLSCERPSVRFLKTPALGAGFAVTSAEDWVEDLTGFVIGPYRVESRIASGGMGTVFLASRADDQFEQRVAIKVVKRGMDSEEILRRFRQERRTLGGLRHPHIALLLDAGALPDGRPYLIMEYVQGEPLSQYCNQRSLGLNDRLRLFKTVCDAVRFAHQQLVIHRDLKPGNILVTADGTPKLLDFGLAKVLGGLGSSEITQDQERRLTPEYASPEQIMGHAASTATDIYSLGIVLYELLTGARPYSFATRNAAEIERVVCVVAPDPPSAAVTRSKPGHRPPDISSRRLRGDLDTIIRKALQKEPSRRYDSVEQLAADIDRYLSGLPVLARPDSLRYRLGKFVRRHKLGTVLVGIALMALLGGAAMALWGEQTALHERDSAFLARDQAEAMTDFLQRMLEAADPTNEGPEAKVRTLLDNAALRVDSDFKDKPLLQASLRSTIGRTYLGLGLFDEAERHIKAAYDQRRSMLAPGEHDLAESEFDVARLDYSRGRYAAAEVLLRSCLATHERLRGLENADTARVLNDLGAVLRAAGNFSEAETMLRRAIAIREKIGGPDSLELAESLNNLAGALRAKGDTRTAVATMTQSLAIRRKLLRSEHPLVLQSIAGLAIVTAEAGDMPAATRMQQEVVKLGAKVYGTQHPSYATDLSSLAQMLALLKRYAEAEPEFRLAWRIRRQHLEPTDVRLLRTQANLGRCLFHLGRTAEAESLFRDTIRTARAHHPSDEPALVNAMDDLAKLLDATGRHAEATALRGAAASRASER